MFSERCREARHRTPHRPKHKWTGKQAAFYIPRNLSLEMFREPLRLPICYILNLLHWKYVCWRADEDGYVRLLSNLITRVLRNDWTEVREQLVAAGIVEWDQTTARGKAYGYRLAESYRKTHRIFCTDDGLNARIEAAYAREEKSRLPIHRWLQAKLDWLDFDLDRALSLVATMRPDKDSPMDPDDYRARLAGQCQRLAGKDHYLVCDRFGRVHTLLTSLPKELRGCLSVRGRPLVGWDLANSQPLIAGLVARQFFRSVDARYRLTNSTFGQEANPYHKGVSMMEVGAALPPDVDKYIRCCEEGRLYESLDADRERVKKAFLTIMFGPNRYRSPMKTAFAGAYPAIARMFHELKRKDHTRAAWIMQNREARIFISAICGRIREERPSLPVYTIHDGVYTVPDGLEYIRRVIESTFGRLGVKPCLRRTGA
jgi:hypothetical protein